MSHPEETVRWELTSGRRIEFRHDRGGWIAALCKDDQGNIIIPADISLRFVMERVTALLPSILAGNHDPQIVDARLAA